MLCYIFLVADVGFKLSLLQKSIVAEVHSSFGDETHVDAIVLKCMEIQDVPMLLI